MAHMHCLDAYLFRVCPTRRTKEERQRWSNTGTTATTSQRIGCRRKKMRAVPQERNSRMVTAMTPVCYREKTRCSLHLSPAGTIIQRTLAKLTADPEAMKHFGKTMVMWDFHTRQ